MNQDHFIKCGKDQDWIGLAAQESPNRLIEWPGPLPYFHIIGPFPPEGGFVRTPRTPPGYGPASTLNLENGTHKQLTGATTEILSISLFQNHVIIIQTTTYAQRNEFHHSKVSSNSSHHLQTYITKSRTHKTHTGSNDLEVPKKWRFKSRDRN